MSISCRELEVLIDEYLEGALGERQQEEFAHHLKACGVCDRYANGYVCTIDLAKAALVKDSESQSGRPEVPVASFLAALRNAMDRDSRSR